MAITRQASAQNLHAASGSPTVTFPGTWTPAENDLVVLFCHTTNTTTVNTVPSGWNDVGGGLVTPGDTTEYVFAVWHLVTSGEAAAVTRTYTVTSLWSGTETNMVMGAVYRGVDITDPVADFGIGSNAGNTTDHELPAIVGTNMVDGGVVVASVSADGAATYTNPTGWDQLQLQTASDPGAYLGERTAATTAGGAVSATMITCSISGEYVAYSVALRPAAGGGDVEAAPVPATVAVSAGVVAAVGTAVTAPVPAVVDVAAGVVAVSASASVAPVPAVVAVAAGTVAAAGSAVAGPVPAVVEVVAGTIDAVGGVSVAPVPATVAVVAAVIAPESAVAAAPVPATVAVTAGTIAAVAAAVAAPVTAHVAVTAAVIAAFDGSPGLFGRINRRPIVAMRMNGRNGVDARINGRHVPIS